VFSKRYNFASNKNKITTIQLNKVSKRKFSRVIYNTAYECCNTKKSVNESG
jgi:hypothetical protein